MTGVAGWRVRLYCHLQCNLIGLLPPSELSLLTHLSSGCIAIAAAVHSLASLAKRVSTPVMGQCTTRDESLLSAPSTLVPVFSLLGGESRPGPDAGKDSDVTYVYSDSMVYDEKDLNEMRSLKLQDLWRTSILIRKSDHAS